jgi:hypothetical protein
MLAGLFWLDGVERGASETPISSASTIVPRSFVSFAPRASGLGQACRGASRPRVGHPHDGSVFQESSAGLALRPVQNVLNDPFHVRGLCAAQASASCRPYAHRLSADHPSAGARDPRSRRHAVHLDCAPRLDGGKTALDMWGGGGVGASRAAALSSFHGAEQATEPLQHDGPVEPVERSVERMSVGRLERNHLADEFGEDEAMFKGLWTVTASSLATSAASSPWRPVPRRALSHRGRAC